MQEFYVKVNAVPTHVMTWGGDMKLDDNTKEIVLLIPGNPGQCGYYTIFCSTIFKELEEKFPVWVVGHAGHDDPQSDSGLLSPQLKGNEHLYDLGGQVKHKVAFINEHIPKHVKIHLLSHSIGAKISIELLKDDDINQQIQQCYLLFPTIERMVQARNGFWFFKIFNRIFPLIQLIYYAFSYLPLFARTWIIYAFCVIASWPNYLLGTVVKGATPEVLDKVWFMAVDEMEKVCEIDANVIKENLPRLKFYYGTTDGWVRTEWFHELTKKFPGIDAELCIEKISHGFVISHGARMGRMVSDWIRKIQKQNQDAKP